MGFLDHFYAPGDSLVIVTKVVAQVARSMFTNRFSTFAFGSGAVVSIAALVLWIMSKTSDPWLTNWAPLLVVSAMALFVSGAHCLDVSERKDRDSWK
jgi:hypothetical protein